MKLKIPSAAVAFALVATSPALARQSSAQSIYCAKQEIPAASTAIMVPGASGGERAAVANQIRRDVDLGQFPHLRWHKTSGSGAACASALARNLTEEDQRRKTSENRKRDAQHSNHQEELPCYAMVSSFWRLLYWFVPVLFPMMRWLAVGEAAGGEVDSTQGVLVVADFTPQASAVAPFTLDVCTVDADIVLQEVLGRFIP
jgi:hypothetical protein